MTVPKSKAGKRTEPSAAPKKFRPNLIKPFSKHSYVYILIVLFVSFGLFAIFRSRAAGNTVTDAPYCSSKDTIQANALYLSSSGNNSNPGTFTAPKFDLQGWTPEAGKTIYLRGGSYANFNAVLWGRTVTGATNNIVIRNYPGELPILAGGASFMSLQSSSAHDIVVHGLYFQSYTDSVISGVADGPAGGLPGRAGGPYNVTIECSTFYRTTSGHGIYLSGYGDVYDAASKLANRVHDWTIKYNNFDGQDDAAPWYVDALGVKHTLAGIHGYHVNDAYNIQIDHNQFSQNHYGILVSTDGQNNWTIENNSFYNNTVAMGVTDYTERCPYLNDPNDPNSGRCMNWTDFHDVIIRKNVVHSLAGQVAFKAESTWLYNQMLTSAPYPKPLAFIESNNTFYGGSCLVRWNGVAGSAGTCFTDLSSYQSALNGLGAPIDPAQGSGDLAIDPQFVDAAQGNFTTNNAQINANGWGCCSVGGPIATPTPSPAPSPITPTPTPTPAGITNVPCTASCLWPVSLAPASELSAGQAVTVGVRWSSSAPGAVTAIRWYKSPGDSGQHTVSLWSSGGGLLSQATSTAETSAGWQQTGLASPINIAAQSMYVASVFNPTGAFSYTTGGLAAAQTTGPLTAPNSVNGIYSYGTSATFPTLSYQATNYFVDVAFSASIATPTPAPTVVPTPAPTPTPTPVPTPLPSCTKSGDANCDGRVNSLDLQAVLSNYGKRTTIRGSGDLTGDGVVNVFDLSQVLRNWGK